MRWCTKNDKYQVWVHRQLTKCFKLKSCSLHMSKWENTYKSVMSQSKLFTNFGITTCDPKDKKTGSDWRNSAWKDLFQMKFHICLGLIFWEIIRHAQHSNVDDFDISSCDGDHDYCDDKDYDDDDDEHRLCEWWVWAVVDHTVKSARLQQTCHTNTPLLQSCRHSNKYKYKQTTNTNT